jgi:hypothetical protein
MKSFSDAEFFLQVLHVRDIANLHQLEGWAQFGAGVGASGTVKPLAGGIARMLWSRIPILEYRYVTAASTMRFTAVRIFKADQ